jgi:hypothetical protein
VWWTLTLAAAAGFGPAVGIHLAMGYTDAGHLAPVIAGIALTVTGLALSRPYLCARPPRTASEDGPTVLGCQTPGNG